MTTSFPDLGTFHIESLIVHGVPRRNAHGPEGVQPTLSQVPSELNDDLRNFFRERLNRTLKRNAFEVEPNPGTASPVPRLISEIVEDKEQLVPASQEMANRLFRTQTGVNPAGLLVVCRGTIAGESACAVLKLEHEEAIRVEATQVEGKPTYNVAHLRDLMLGENTRVFKGALFCGEDDDAGDDAATSIVGLVSDNQANARGAGAVASFFLYAFLGYQFRSAPEISTKNYFESVQAWVNELPDPVARGRYEVALIAEMNATRAVVTPASFLTEAIDSVDRAALRRYLTEAGAPVVQFQKDTRLIRGKIQQMSITFGESSIRVAGTPEDVEEYVRINAPDANAAPVEILDKVKEIRGGR